MGLFGFGKKRSNKVKNTSAGFDSYEDDDEYDDSEALSVYDAALIWISNGKDEDYMFGYTEEELENAL